MGQVTVQYLRSITARECNVSRVSAFLPKCRAKDEAGAERRLVRSSWDWSRVTDEWRVAANC
jgi:hypothetical protein